METLSSSIVGGPTFGTFTLGHGFHFTSGSISATFSTKNDPDVGFLFPFVGVEGAFGALLPGVAVCTWLYVGRIRSGFCRVHLTLAPKAHHQGMRALVVHKGCKTRA